LAALSFTALSWGFYNFAESAVGAKMIPLAMPGFTARNGGGGSVWPFVVAALLFVVVLLLKLAASRMPPGNSN